MAEKDKVSLLIRRAIDGVLKMDSLEAEWKKLSAEFSLPDALLEDLREGVQHTPGAVLSGKVDLKIWHSMREHAVLVCDLLLVPFMDDRDRWNKLRGQAIDGLDDYSYQAVEKKLKAILKN